MRVFCLSIRHKTNTFAREPTTFRDFQLFRGALQIDSSGCRPDGLVGFFQALEAAGFECIPAFSAAAPAGGIISGDAFEKLSSAILSELAACQPLDAILVDLTGAAASEAALDCDGAWLSGIRGLVGSRTTIVATVDLQANLSPTAVQATNAILAPPLGSLANERDTARAAAQLLVRALRKEVRLTQAAAWPAVVISNDRKSFGGGACGDVVARIGQELDQRHILAGGVAFGFPYADAPNMGLSVVVVTDNAPLLAQRSADNLASFIVERRADFQHSAITIEQAIERIRRSQQSLTLLDTGDSVPDGSTGEGTVLLAAIIEARVSSTLIHIVDADSTAQCYRAKPGETVELALGGKTDWRLGEPLQIVGTVKFTMATARVAIVDLESGPTVLLTAERIRTSDAWQRYKIDTDSFRTLVAKQAVLSTTAKSQKRRHALSVNTPGPTTLDLAELAYHRRKRPMYPFEEFS
jgi:microcystin degradation protein MlrC